MARKSEAIITVETIAIVVSTILFCVGGIIFAICRILAEIIKQLTKKPKAIKGLPKMLGILFNVTGGVAKGVNESYKDLSAHRKYTVQNYLDEARELVLARKSEEKHYQNLNNLKRLISGTEGRLYYSIEKTEFPGEGRIREYVNFLTYDHDTVATVNANDMINDALNNVLGIYKGKSKKLHGTVVLEDYACDMKDITRNLQDTLGIEVKMVVA